MHKYTTMFDRILVDQLREAGLDLQDLTRVEEDTPVFARVYSEEARLLGATAEEVFEQDLVRLKGGTYPSDDCLRPHEVEAYARTGELDPELRAHLAGCAACTALLGGIQVDRQKLEDFLSEIKKRLSGASEHAEPVYENDQTTDLGGVATERTPVINVVGDALRTFADRVSKDAKRRQILRAVLTYLKTRLRRPSFDLDILYQADRTKLQGWAVESLLNLYIPLSQTGRHALVWHYVIACVPRDYPCRILSKLCRGIVYEVAAPVETSGLIRHLAPIFEDHRLGNPFPSNQSMQTAALEAMTATAANETKLGRAIDTTLREILTSDELNPNVDEIVNALGLLAASRTQQDEARLQAAAQPVTALYREKLGVIRKKAGQRGLKDIVRVLR